MTVAERFSAGPGSRAVGLSAGGVPEILLGEHRPLPAASVLKVPLAIAALELLSEREPEPSSIEVQALRRTRYPSVLGGLPPQLRIDLPTACGLALTCSDNDCARWLLEVLRPGALTMTLAELDLRDTHLEASFDDEALGEAGRANQLSGGDALRLLRALHDDPRLQPVEAMLRDHLRNSRLPGQLDERLPVAHQTGTLSDSGVVADIGLLHGRSGTLALAVLCDRQPELQAVEAEIAALAAELCGVLGVQPWAGL